MLPAPLQNPEQFVASVMASVMRPAAKPDYNSWAEENVVFGRESPVPGPYRRSTSPLIERILDVLSPEHPARVVVLTGSAQIFKTTVAQIFVAATMDLDPCEMLYTHPTNDNALRWARGKWRQMRANSAPLKRIFGGEIKSRSTTDTTLYQVTKDGRGSLQISGANSAASLSMITVSKQVQDDLSKWEPNTGGDPERQADSRSSSFDWAKILKTSTPLKAKECRITRAYRNGTQERWHVPCPHCETLQPLTWDNFASNIDPERPELAHFTCISCGEKIEHRDKQGIIARGRWIAENPRAIDPSFHVWRAYSPTRDWASIAREWLESEGNPYSEQTFFNDVLGLPYESAGEAPPWQALRDRAELGENVFDRGMVPPGGLILGCGIDCQIDRTEVHIKAFGAAERRWTIDYRIIPHHIGTPQCRQALDNLVKVETWPDHFGNRRPLDVTAIDANAWTKDVFAWAKHHPWDRVICVRGAKSEHAPRLKRTHTETRDDGRVRKSQKRFYNVGTSQMKADLYQNLAKGDPLARGYCGYPRGLGDEFFRQLTAEKRQVKVDKYGFPNAAWVKDHDRNEVLDTEIYCEAAAIRAGFYSRSDVDWRGLEALLEKPRERGTPDLFDPAAPAQAGAAKFERPASDSAKRGEEADDIFNGRTDNYWG